MMGTPLLHPQITAAMVAHARFCDPEEACGLLAGEPGEPPRMVYSLTNADASTTAFTVDPDEHFAALRHAERSGMELVGAFHSHPRSPAVPSRTDIARALEPDWLYVIVGLVDGAAPEIRAWRIRDGETNEVAATLPEAGGALISKRAMEAGS